MVPIPEGMDLPRSGGPASRPWLPCALFDQHLVNTHNSSILRFISSATFPLLVARPEGLGISNSLLAKRNQLLLVYCPCLCSFLNLCHTLYAICNISHIHYEPHSCGSQRKPGLSKGFLRNVPEAGYNFMEFAQKTSRGPGFLSASSLLLLPLPIFTLSEHPVPHSPPTPSITPATSRRLFSMEQSQWLRISSFAPALSRAWMV